MRAPFHVLAGLVGVAAGGAAGAAYCLANPALYAASALVAADSAADRTSPLDINAMRALVATEPVLRRAALAPAAAAAIEKEARPGPLDRIVGLTSGHADDLDTMSRAARLLADRVAIAPGLWPDTARVVVQMRSPAAAAQVATAVAEALAADLNEAAGAVDGRSERDRRAALERAERRRDETRARLQALRAADMTPTGATSPAADNRAGRTAIAELERAAAAADARRAEAARTYGPRHPQLIQFETDARRAAQALSQARVRLAADARKPPGSSAEGGPDPRAGELEAAEQEAARAEGDYRFEAARKALPRHAARLVRPAEAPAAPTRPATSMIVGGSALLGFLLFGAGPALRSRSAPARRDERSEAPLARVRRGAFDRAGAARVVDAMQIERDSDARRIAVLGESAAMAQEGACALAMAASDAGWRTLLIVADGNVRRRPAAGRRIAALDRVAIELERIPDVGGELAVGRGTIQRGRRPVDGARMFDLAIVEHGAASLSIDAVVWIGRARPDEAALARCDAATRGRAPLLGWIACG